MAKNQMPVVTNRPRNTGATNMKKGGTTKTTKRPLKKYQYEGTVTKGQQASSAARSGANAAKKALEQRIASMSAADKAKAAKAAGNAAAKRVYDGSGAKANPTLFAIDEVLRPFMGMPTVNDEMNVTGYKASDRIMNLKKEKRGGSVKASSKPKTAMKKMGKK